MHLDLPGGAPYTRRLPWQRRGESLSSRGRGTRLGLNERSLPCTPDIPDRGRRRRCLLLPARGREGRRGRDLPPPDQSADRPRIRSSQPGRPEDQGGGRSPAGRSEEHTSELQSRRDLVCRLLLEKKKKNKNTNLHKKKKKNNNNT